MAAPVLLALDDRHADEIRARLPSDRRHDVVTSPQEAADRLRPYLDLGFTGFTFNDTYLTTPDAVARIGELLALIA